MSAGFKKKKKLYLTFLSVSPGWCLPEISLVKSASVCMSTWSIHLSGRVIHLSLLLQCACDCGSVVCVFVSWTCEGFSPPWQLWNFKTVTRAFPLVDGETPPPPPPPPRAGLLCPQLQLWRCALGFVREWTGFREESFSLGDIISWLRVTAGHLAPLPASLLGGKKWVIVSDRRAAAAGSEPCGGAAMPFIHPVSVPTKHFTSQAEEPQTAFVTQAGRQSPLGIFPRSLEELTVHVSVSPRKLVNMMMRSMIFVKFYIIK